MSQRQVTKAAASSAKCIGSSNDETNDTLAVPPEDCENSPVILTANKSTAAAKRPAVKRKYSIGEGGSGSCYLSTKTLNQPPLLEEHSAETVGKRIRANDFRETAALLIPPSKGITEEMKSGLSEEPMRIRNSINLPDGSLSATILRSPPPFSVLEAKIPADLLEAKRISVQVRPLIGEAFTVSLPGDCAVYDLKDAISRRLDVPYEVQILTLSSTSTLITNEDAFLDESGVVDGSVVNLSVQMSCGVEAPTFQDFSLADEADLNLYQEMLLSNGSPSNFMEQLFNLGGMESGGIPLATCTPTITEPPLKLSDEGAILNRRISGPLEDLDALKISLYTSSSSDEDEDGHSEVSGPLGASIFSPTPPPKQKESLPVTSHLTGSSACAKCHRRCRIAQRFECRCGLTFCPQHRYPDQHACSFDHKAHDRTVLALATPHLQSINSKLNMC